MKPSCFPNQNHSGIHTCVARCARQLRNTALELKLTTQRMTRSAGRRSAPADNTLGLLIILTDRLGRTRRGHFNTRANLL